MASGKEALAEIQTLHWSFLNDGYYKPLLDNWKLEAIKSDEETTWLIDSMLVKLSSASKMHLEATLF